MQKNTHIVITPRTNLLDIRLGELIRYQDLIWLFFKRNYITRYKQTVLGPAWLIISPLFTMMIYTIVFGRIAGLSTDHIPQPLFYMTGNIFWCLFSDCLYGAASTFTGNTGIFGKVYFPRLVVPVSNMITSCADFIIKLGLLAILIGFYAFRGDGLFLSGRIVILPLLMLQVCLTGMGIGILVSALTTKYRDLQVLVGFGMQIWMYATPVIYSRTMIPQGFQKLFMCNPVTPAVLLFKNIFFGTDADVMKYWGISWVITVFIFFFGVIVFNQAEKNFMDTV